MQRKVLFWSWVLMIPICLGETIYYAVTGEWYKAGDKFYHLSVAMALVSLLRPAP